MIVPAAFLFLSAQSAVAVAMSAPPLPPAASGIAHGPEAHGTAASLFSPDDYPAKAAGTGAHGTTDVRLTIDTTGHVSACAITHSSGNGALDAATCNILRRRAHYSPAIDRFGRPVVSMVDEEIRWRAP